MTVPIRSMPVPAPNEVIATIRSYDDLVEALRTIKAIHGLSNAWCDEIGGLTTGHTDKVLGPSGTKGLSRMTMDVFFQLFAVSLEMRIDIDQARKMEARWEQRESGRIHVDDNRVSKKVLQKAKPLVMQAHMKAANAARNTMLSCEHRSKIASIDFKQSSQCIRLFREG